MWEYPSGDDLALANLKSLSLTVGRGPVPRHLNCLNQDFQDERIFRIMPIAATKLILQRTTL